MFMYLQNSDIWELNDNQKKTLKSYNKQFMSKLKGMCLFLCELCLYFVKVCAQIFLITKKIFVKV